MCGPLRVQTDTVYDDRRGNSTERGYDRRWRKRRAMFLRAHPLCAQCLEENRVTTATDVHHVIARRNGGSDDDGNLMSLCKSHHSQITAAGG